MTRDKAGRFLGGAAWTLANPGGSPTTGRHFKRRKMRQEVCWGCGDLMECYKGQRYHNRRCRDRYRAKRLKGQGFWRDSKTKRLVRTMRQLTDAQRARLPIRDALTRAKDGSAYDPTRGGWSDPRQAKVGPALELVMTEELENELARLDPHLAREVLAGVLVPMAYEGREVYGRSSHAQMLGTVLVLGLRWLRLACRRKGAAAAFSLASDHAKAKRIAEANGLGSQLEAQIPGESAYLRFKRQNRADAQSP